MLGSDLFYDGLGSPVAEKYLALAVNDVLLKVHRHGLGRAEILHCLRNLDPQFIAKAIERVNSMAGRENDCGVIQNVYPLRPELSGREGLDEKELLECDVNAEFLFQCDVGCVVHRSAL